MFCHLVAALGTGLILIAPESTQIYDISSFDGLVCVLFTKTSACQAVTPSASAGYFLMCILDKLLVLDGMQMGDKHVRQAVFQGFQNICAFCGNRGKISK